MRPSSAKAKGRSGQQEVRDLLLARHPQLKPDDIRSTSMGCDGEDLLLSPYAREFYPWCIEIKRKKSIAACRFMEQAESHGDYVPVAIFREDRGEWYAMVTLDYLLNLEADRKNS